MLERPERVTERFPLAMDPPFKLDNTRTFLFVVACDIAHIDALLARTFGWARPHIAVRAAAPICLITFTDTANATAASPMLGSFAYREATLFLPIWGERNGKPFFALHVPFIYPNEGLAVASGRETYGLPKKPGIVEMPTAEAFFRGDAPLSLRVLSAARFDGSPWTERALLRIECDPQDIPERHEDELHAALDTFITPPSPKSAPASVPPSAPASGQPVFGGLLGQALLQLKQIQDVHTGGFPRRVVYRAVTHVHAPVRKISNVRLGDASRVHIRVGSLASEPIRDVLGLPETMTPLLAASLTMNFRLNEGEVWREEPDSGSVPRRKTRVLVLGGGIAALTAAHALTDTESRRATYDVRVLVQGHFLGGKGASTRDPAFGERNIEHGIHVLFGFYHNTLRLLRNVYDEAARPCDVKPSTFNEAFKPEHTIVFHDGTCHQEVTLPETPSGYGAGPTSLSDQLKALESLVSRLVGAPLSGIITSALFPSLGNKMAREIVAFAATLLKGVLEDVVIGGCSFDDLDDQDFREWMASHRIFGLPDVSETAIMQVPYDGVFAYEGRDQTRPRLSAGIAARGLLKLVSDYEIAPYFAMTAGMGECVFAPLYEVLKRRGVTFEFLSKVKEVTIDGGRVAEVAYARQAEVVAGPMAYNPMISAGRIPSFRPTPDLTQLVSPAPIDGKDPYSDSVTCQSGPDVRLRVDTNFDWVVCALPAPVTANVLRGHLDYRPLARIKSIPTVATLHVQTWFNNATSALGWTSRAQVLGGFPQPLNSMHMRDAYLSIESWIGPEIPRGLLYMSGPFGAGWDVDASDPPSRERAEAAARAEAYTFVRDELWRAMPSAKIGTPPYFDERFLFAPTAPHKPMTDQVVRANIDISSRYVLASPGGLRNRPATASSGVANLRLAGDWTRNGIDIPCVEGAVVSALAAASSILSEELDVLW
jgi:uncharacterized protein with NAD-binding domain and iron-sulfur cluster